MIAPQIARIRQEWQANRRLRLGALVILLVAGAHIASGLGERRSAIASDYRRELELLRRLQDASREALWPKRAAQVEAALQAERASLPTAPTAGAAKAEMQAWLNAQVPPTGVRVERIQVEAATDVPDHPGFWQVPARVDVVAPLGTVGGFMRRLSEALPWIQAERVEASGEGETRLSVILRGYYRKGPRAAAPTKPPADGTAVARETAAPKDATPPAGGVVPSIARSPAADTRGEARR